MQQSFYCRCRGGGSWEKSRALSRAFPCLLAVGRVRVSISRAAGAGSQCGSLSSGGRES